MFRTILWATDGSAFADGALQTVLELASTHQSRIVVAHADRLLVGRFGEAPSLADEVDIRDKLERQVGDLRAAGFEAEIRTELGVTMNAAQLIAAAARETHADLIVLASHSRGTLGSAMLGSVSRTLLHEAPCPVLVVPPEAARPMPEICRSEGAGV